MQFLPLCKPRDVWRWIVTRPCFYSSCTSKIEDSNKTDAKLEHFLRKGHFFMNDICIIITQGCHITFNTLCIIMTYLGRNNWHRRYTMKVAWRDVISKNILTHQVVVLMHANSCRGSSFQTWQPWYIHFCFESKNLSKRTCSSSASKVVVSLMGF